MIYRYNINSKCATSDITEQMLKLVFTYKPRNFFYFVYQLPHRQLSAAGQTRLRSDAAFIRLKINIVCYRW